MKVIPDRAPGSPILFRIRTTIDNVPFVPPPDRPALMGILNVTPDSFSDGGRYFGLSDAVEAGLRLRDEGADLVDVGGESTRPGAEPVTADEELRRVLPVVERLAARGVPISIDTSKAQVAKAAIEAGAVMVNDVTAGRDEKMAPLCGSIPDLAVCLMHMLGEPRTMQADPRYGDVVTEVRDFLVARAGVFEEFGMAPSRVWIDPGIGFGKTVTHNLDLLARLGVLVATGYPVAVGVSRKSFLGRLLAIDGEPAPVEDRLEGTLAAQVLAQASGARLIRAHDVRAARRAIDVAAAILAAGS